MTCPCCRYRLSLAEWIAQTPARAITAEVLAEWAAAAQELVAPPVQANQTPTSRERGKAAPSAAAPIRINVEQRALIEQAIEKVRLTVEDASLAEGRAIELISADFLASA